MSGHTVHQRLCERTACEYPAGECSGACLRGAQLTQAGVRHPFAPGVIERGDGCQPTGPQARQRAALLRWLMVVAVLVLGVPALGLMVGLMRGLMQG